MKFAHFSDAHLGSWSGSPDMRDFSVQAFEKAVGVCLAERVDFIVISGDLYDSPMPPYDVLSRSVLILRRCATASVPVYVVPGSHDFSPSEKTFISVLENAGLVKNVAKMHDENGKLVIDFTVDEKTGAKLAGMMGKPGGMEKEYFTTLAKESTESGFRIFVFHSALDEFKPIHMKGMASVPKSLLPKGFDYYAAGHVHKPKIIDNGNIVYPGALFPTELAELEEYEPGIHIIDTEKKSNARLPIKLFGVVRVDVNADGLTAAEAEKKMLEKARAAETGGKLLLVNATGTLSSGAPSDVNFAAVREAGIAAGAFTVKRNFVGLSSVVFEETKSSSFSVEAIEREMIAEYCGKSPPPSRDAAFAAAVMRILDDEKQEGETVSTYETRIKDNAMKLMNI
ncbi:MAG: exonuclease SbcCD subunit D [Candidatus Aenigmarchaeota archaeon]|nr:exonuclease SbcCD subunit D [Candidatus Aenigmarchaeota archaeon]